jgi:histidine ammonia-lyase
VLVLVRHVVPRYAEDRYFAADIAQADELVATDAFKTVLGVGFAEPAE